MSLEDREALLEEMRGRLREIVPAAIMDRILKTASESMAKFDIVQLTEEETRKDDLLQYYLGARRVQGRSQKTIDLYAYTIGRMLADVKVPAGKVTIHHLRSWIAKEQARGISGTTLNGDRQIFCAFFNWLQRESLIEKNPVANLGAIKCARKKREAYSETDTEKLKRACDNTRDLALINFLESTGCRISEALGLDREDVDMERGECVVHGKGDKERRVYMDAVTVMTIKEYLDGRKDEEQALFIGKKRCRLTPSGARRALKRVGAEAGVENVHPHRFRRTLATGLARHGMPIQEVAAIMGHEKLDTTMKYVVLDDERVRNSYRRYT